MDILQPELHGTPLCNHVNKSTTNSWYSQSIFVDIFQPELHAQPNRFVALLSQQHTHVQPWQHVSNQFFAFTKPLYGHTSECWQGHHDNMQPNLCIHQASLWQCFILSEPCVCACVWQHYLPFFGYFRKQCVLCMCLTKLLSCSFFISCVHICWASLSGGTFSRAINGQSTSQHPSIYKLDKLPIPQLLMLYTFWVSTFLLSVCLVLLSGFPILLSLCYIVAVHL